MKILVAYASRHGAIEGIAERVSQTLRRAGLDVSLQQVNEVDAVDGYDAFVIGSAAYMGGWLGDATEFVHRNRDLLAGRPVWLFSSGPVGTDALDAKGREPLEASKPKEFEEFARTINPRAQQVFFGAYDPDAPSVGLAEGLMSKVLRVAPAARKALPAGDYRDWPAIEAWAEVIARELQPVGATA
jgi:menaquinone-dependent protoporphyrinogen oxidase